MRVAETIAWAGGEHSFRLAIAQLRAIEQRCDAGVSVVLLRLLGQNWKVDDVLSPIRLGLIGGGMSEDDAKKVIDKALDESSLYGMSITAADVMRRFIMWEGDDAPGEQQAGAGNQTQTRSPTEEPDGAATTAPGKPSE